MLDCIASGTLWVDMVEIGVDVLISAPQKGWSGPPCAGLVMLGDAVEHLALKAQRIGEGAQAPFAPAPIEEVVAAIEARKPDLVFAAHVETSSGMLLPDDYLRAVAEAVHETGGLFVLDCIASGTLWIDMVEIVSERHAGYLPRAAQGLPRGSRSCGAR